jgi:hypothetical protein
MIGEWPSSSRPGAAAASSRATGAHTSAGARPAREQTHAVLRQPLEGALPSVTTHLAGTLQSSRQRGGCSKSVRAKGAARRNPRSTPSCAAAIGSGQRRLRRAPPLRRRLHLARPRPSAPPHPDRVCFQGGAAVWHHEHSDPRQGLRRLRHAEESAGARARCRAQAACRQAGRARVRRGWPRAAHAKQQQQGRAPACAILRPLHPSNPTRTRPQKTKPQDKLIDPTSVTRVFKITKHIGMLATGLEGAPRGGARLRAAAQGPSRPLARRRARGGGTGAAAGRGRAQGRARKGRADEPRSGR